MRLIAVLGGLFVLASCSDSDMEENFGLSCYEEGYESQRIYYEFYFDKNIVIKKSYPGEAIEELFSEYDITNISLTTISFGSQPSILYGENHDEYTFDRATFTIRNDIRKDGNSLKNYFFKCELPKI